MPSFIFSCHIYQIFTELIFQTADRFGPIFSFDVSKKNIHIKVTKTKAMKFYHNLHHEGKIRFLAPIITG